MLGLQFSRNSRSHYRPIQRFACIKLNKVFCLVSNRGWFLFLKNLNECSRMYIKQSRFVCLKETSGRHKSCQTFEIAFKESSNQAPFRTIFESLAKLENWQNFLLAKQNSKFPFGHLCELRLQRIRPRCRRAVHVAMQLVSVRARMFANRLLLLALLVAYRERTGCRLSSTLPGSNPTLQL